MSRTSGGRAELRPRRRPARPNHVTLTRIAFAVVLASGWRRAAIAFAPAPCRRWRWRRSTRGRCCFSPSPFWSGWSTARRAGRGHGFWHAFAAGWCFGFGFFIAGLYWIGYAFLVDAKTFGWLLPIAVAGLPAYLAIYTGLGLGLARLIWVRGAFGCSRWR